MAIDKRVLRIRVTHGDTPKVTVRVPLGLARLVRIGGVADQLSERHGVDLDEILRTIEDLPNEKIVDVIDETSGEHIEIFLEADCVETANDTPLAAHQ
ncbi:MAG: hypothetical protein WEC79_06880 [Thermomicrobiales bacterium]